MLKNQYIFYSTEPIAKVRHRHSGESRARREASALSSPFNPFRTPASAGVTVLMCFEKWLDVSKECRKVGSA
jgi:hypothetical protein